MIIIIKFVVVLGDRVAVLVEAAATKVIKEEQN
jgi:hypothetical protein